MSQEAELKLLVEDSNQAAVLQLCQQLAKGQQATVLTLQNSYFDTPEGHFRKAKMGLRVRQQQQQFEQTIKLAGRSLAGLHQRPEYNVAITESHPDLSLFAPDIWPDDFPALEYQRDLLCLFSTDFERHRWRIPSGDGQIELVFDQGYLRCGEQQQVIAEIELELQGGLLSDLYALARRLISRLGARLGHVSKAGRGYRLWQAQQLPAAPAAEPELAAARLQFVAQEPQASLGEGLSHALAMALQHWQRYDQSFTEQAQVAAVAGIAEGMRWVKVILQQLSLLELEVNDEIVRIEQLLGHFGWLSRYDGLTELIATDGAYHRTLEEHPALYDEIVSQQQHVVQLEQISQLLRREDYQLLMLDLGALLHSDQSHQLALQQPLKQWSIQRLREDWQQVVGLFQRQQELRPEHYLKHLPVLQNSLYLGYCVGSLFDPEDREDFRAPWQDMVRGIREIMALKLLREAIRDVDDVHQERLLNWQTVQLESLLYALEHSRRAALKQQPYWEL